MATQVTLSIPPLQVLTRLTVIFVTDRPAALAFVVDQGQQRRPQLDIIGIPLAPDSMRRVLKSIDRTVDAIVLDIADAPDQAVDVCRIIREEAIAAPVVALLCCTQPTTHRHVRTLLDLGVASLLDARIEPSKLFDAITNGRGANSIHVALSERSWLTEDSPRQQLGVPTARGESLTNDQAEVVRLVAVGLTNKEIGQMLHLAPSTVHHRIGELCAQLEIRNRVALAGWAGANRYLEAVAV